MSRTAEWCCALFAFLALNLAYAGSQPLNNFLQSNAHEEPGVDGQVYRDMARSMPRELPPQGVAPFVYRLGTPLLAAALAKSQDWVISAGFDRLNIAFNALSVALLLLVLQRHVPSVVVRLLIVVAFMVQPHSPVRYTYFQPLAVEPAMLAFLLAGLLGVEWFRSSPSPWRATTVALIVASGVIFHEAVLVVGVCMLLSAAPSAPHRWRERWNALEQAGAWLPLIGGLAMVYTLHAWVVATPSDYSALADALRWLREKSMLRYLLAWFLVFGPMLAVPIYFWRRSLAFLREQPALFSYLAAFALLAWFGGGDTERFLVMASPVVYVLIGRSMTWAPWGSVVAGAGLVLAQALSARFFAPIGGPVDPPQIGSEIWERLGAAGAAGTLSYDSMWAQYCTPSMLGAYAVWFGLTAGGVLAYLRRSNDESPTPSRVGRMFATLPLVWRRLTNRHGRWTMRLLIAGLTLIALAPVAWLSMSRFYWTHYDQQGSGYVLYNLGRLWTLAVLLLVFWATGSRIARVWSAPDNLVADKTGRFYEYALSGAAAWALGMVVLASAHLYYIWMVLPLVGVALFNGVAQLMPDRRTDATAPTSASQQERWGIVGLLLRLAIVLCAGGLLLTIALWGNFGPDNDVPGNYLPYYDTVLKAHSNEPNGYWVHYFVSKGHGLAFLFNILSDVQGASLVSWLVLMLGAGMIGRLAMLQSSSGQTIGLVGVCVYLLFFAEQGAYAKGHIVRNTLILSLILASARSLYFRLPHSKGDALGRLVVITAIILLSPLAIVLLLPILLMETGLNAISGRLDEARRSLIYPAWATAAALLVCGFNYLQVGVPELHNMPSAVGAFVDFDRLSRWLDPRLAFVDYRLGFLRDALSGTDVPAASPLLPEALPVGQILRGVFNLSTLIWLGGAVGIGASGVFLLRGRGASRPFGGGAAWAVCYLAGSLGIVTLLRMFGGGAGSSMARFTDFTTPLGIALGVVILTATWMRSMSRVARGMLATSITFVSAAALYSGLAPMLEQRWRASVGFVLGQNPYAVMYDSDWDTVVAHRVAGAIPAGEKVELLNFLPGFTAIPETPFQRPDGGAYIKDYTAILYGSEEMAEDIYRSSGIGFFLFDLSASDVAVSGFAPLFAPESIRSRMRLVRHDTTARRDLYLMAWKNEQDAAPDELFELFLREWGSKVATARKIGTYHWAYDEGARHFRGGP